MSDQEFQVTPPAEAVPPPAPPGSTAPPVPGTGETDPSVVPATPAGAENTEEAQPPGPIPYARFKEVNDSRRELEEQLQPFRDLEGYGYNAAELQRLATWEQEYSQDPAGTWLRIASEIEGLPDEVKAAVSAHTDSTQGAPVADGTPPQPASEDAGGEEKVPEWGQKLLSQYEQQQAEAQNQAISTFYDGLRQSWLAMDEKQGLVDAEGKSTTPEAVIHAFFAAYAPSAGSATELLQSAREAWLSSREATLQSAIQRPGQGGTVPRSVPGSGGVGAGAPPVMPRTLDEATKAAKQALESGSLGS